MNIITSGYPYIDIDAYAGCVAYAELLNALGQPAKAVSTAPLNESITATIQAWQAPIETIYAPSSKDRYVLVDLSNPDYFEKFATPSQVSEVIDHHPGFETYWQKRLGERAQIEPIGSVCTIIYERWGKADKLDSISTLSARLLATGILENTLNFGAVISTERDHVAYEAVKRQADLPDDWPARYFGEMQATIVKDLPTALKNDTKSLPFKTFPHNVTVGQLVVWDVHEIVQQQDIIEATLAKPNQPWFLNLVSVFEKKSYFIATNPEVQWWLSRLLSLTFDDSIATANRLWLRKEIITQDLTNIKIAV